MIITLARTAHLCLAAAVRQPRCSKLRGHFLVAGRYLADPMGLKGYPALANGTQRKPRCSNLGGGRRPLSSVLELGDGSRAK
jgi:hypothetical protein